MTIKYNLKESRSECHHIAQVMFSQRDKADDLIEELEKVKESLPEFTPNESGGKAITKQVLILENRAVKIMDLCTEIASWIGEH